MQAAFLYKDQIKDDIVFLSQSKKQKGSERNILNKWFQDSIKNYFLETYASPFLKNELGEGFVKKVKQNIEKRMASDGLKFMNLLNQYKIELEAFGKATKFVNSLISIVIDDQKLDHGSALWAKQVKKKFVALMLIVLMEYNETRVSSFYDMWNYIFPSETQIKKKLSKDDKLRLKCETQANTNSSAGNSNQLVQGSLLSPANSSTTLQYHYKHINHPLQQQNPMTKSFPDTSSQCSRTCEFQELDGIQVVKKFQLDPKQEGEQFYQNSHPQILHHTNHFQQQHFNQNQHQISQHQPFQFQFVNSQPFNSLQQSEMALRQAQNQQNLAQHPAQLGNTNMINNQDIFRRMSTVFSLKQDITDPEIIHLDDQQFFIDRQEDGIPGINIQQAPNLSQANQFSFEPHSIFQNLQNQQQPQVQNNPFKYTFQEHNSQNNGNQIVPTLQLSKQASQLSAMSQQASTGQGHISSNGYFYSNNLDMNSYFNVDQLFASNGISSNQHNF